MKITKIAQSTLRPPLPKSKGITQKDVAYMQARADEVENLIAEAKINLDTLERDYLGLQSKGANLVITVLVSNIRNLCGGASKSLDALNKTVSKLIPYGEPLK